MTPGADDVQEKIIAAAIECIERDGVQGATIRNIAREAGVNSAAISYYFRSKDRLLEAALLRTRQEGSTKALEELDLYEAESGDLRAALRTLLLEQFTGMVRYPRIVQWHLGSPMAGDERGGASHEYWDEFFEAFFRKVRPLLGDAPEEDLRISIVQMWSAMLMSGIMPDLFRGFSGMDPRDPEVAARYVDRLLDHFLGPAERP